MHWISSLCGTVSSCDDPQNMGIWQVFNKQFAAGMNWSSAESSLSSAEETVLLTHLFTTKEIKDGKNKIKSRPRYLLPFQKLIMRDLIFWRGSKSSSNQPTEKHRPVAKSSRKQYFFLGFKPIISRLESLQGAQSNGFLQGCDLGGLFCSCCIKNLVLAHRSSNCVLYVGPMSGQGQGRQPPQKWGC